MHALFRGISVIPVLTIDRERDAVPLARALSDGGTRQPTGYDTSWNISHSRPGHASSQRANGAFIAR